MARRKSKKSSGMGAAQGTLVQPLSSIRATGGANEEFDRSTVVTARSAGATVSASASITVIQLGLREPFIPADDTEAFQTNDGEDFGVLKQ